MGHPQLLICLAPNLLICDGETSGQNLNKKKIKALQETVLQQRDYISPQRYHCAYICTMGPACKRKGFPSRSKPSEIFGCIQRRHI